MVTPTVSIRPLFAVPTGHARLEQPERLNAALEALFLAREGDDTRNPTPSHRPQDELFESRFNLFRWPDPCVQELRSFMLESIGRTILETTELKPADLARLKLQNHTWFHTTRHAGSFVAHNHPLASWSAVYCVRAGSPVPDEPRSGLLRFQDPRAGADAYRDAANARMRPPYGVGAVEFRLAEGQLVVFPSYVFHEVAPFYGQDCRITVATNCWFTGS